MSEEVVGLEAALEAVERDADSAIRILGATLKAAKRAKAAAATGQLRDLEQAMDGAASLAAQAATSADELRASWTFDASRWLESGAYAEELLAAAAAAGVRAVASDDRILCYPAIVQISSADAAVAVDRKKDRRIRPSVVVSHLQALQQRPPKFSPAAFIESLAAAYDYVATAKRMRPGAPARLVDIHRVLTLLPGAARDYTRPEFARDIYLLDQSGVVDCRDGRRMSLPASALTRGGGVLTTVARSGQIKVYAGLAFIETGA